MTVKELTDILSKAKPDAEVKWWKFGWILSAIEIADVEIKDDSVVFGKRI